MNTKEIENLNAFSGNEGTQIRQIFSPNDTDNAIRYSLAHCTIKPGSNSKPHKMKTSEIYYILQGSGIMHIEEEQKTVKKKILQLKDHAIYGVDTMEKLQYVRGQIRSLEDLQQDLKDLLTTTEYEDEQVHGDTETD